LCVSICHRRCRTIRHIQQIVLEFEGKSESFPEFGSQVDRGALTSERTLFNVKRAQIAIDRAQISCERAQIVNDRAQIVNDRAEISCIRAEIANDRADISCDRAEIEADLTALAIDLGALDAKSATISFCPKNRDYVTIFFWLSP